MAQRSGQRQPEPAAAERSQWADPVASGNIYCADRLDQVLRRVVLPLREELDDAEDNRRPWLWTMRYRCRGEHLKVRIHGPRDEAERWSERLRHHAEKYLAALDAPAAESTHVQKGAVPIDREDEVREPAEDRTYLPTHYRRSHVSLGGEPFLEDDDYALRFCRAQSAATDLVLQLLADGDADSSSRQQVLLRAVAAGLGVSGLDAERWPRYLAYHRDWLVRFALGWHDRYFDQAWDLLRLFEQRVDDLPGAVRERLGGLLDSAAQGESGVSPSPEWSERFAALNDEIERWRGDPAADRLDPFAEDYRQTPWFKSFHGLSNQLGLNVMEEAFTHHLLFRAVEDDGERYFAAHQPTPEEAAA